MQIAKCCKNCEHWRHKEYRKNWGKCHYPDGTYRMGDTFMTDTCDLFTISPIIAEKYKTNKRSHTNEREM